MNLDMIQQEAYDQLQMVEDARKLINIRFGLEQYKDDGPAFLAYVKLLLSRDNKDQLVENYGQTGKIKDAIALDKGLQDIKQFLKSGSTLSNSSGWVLMIEIERLKSALSDKAWSADVQHGGL